MKKTLLLTLIPILILFSAGCAQEQEPQTEDKTGTLLFEGQWFDVKYPASFTANPEDGSKTDEAYFSSKDGTVEFFVYSPIWSGDPENYLKTDENEEIVSQNTAKISDNITLNVNIKAKDGSYYRSFTSIREQIDTGSELHHVFGIKYKDDATYEKYEEMYEAFKNSLKQYAD